LKFCASITARTQSPKTYSTNQPKVVRVGLEPVTTSGIVSLTAIWIVHFHRIQLLAIASTIPPPDYVATIAYQGSVGQLPTYRAYDPAQLNHRG
jgi:hypothetical protein